MKMSTILSEFSVPTIHMSKKIGDKIEQSKPWANVQEDKLAEVQRAKYNQNTNLRDQLIGTREVKLIEATVGGFWGINGSIHSKAAKEESGNGKNKFGQILMQIRSEYTSPPLPPRHTPTPPPPPSPHSDPPT